MSPTESVESAIFEPWSGLARTLLVGVLGYTAIVFLLRISGPRTLSKMNAFDFVVTVALGSTLASTIVSDSVPLTSGVVAFAVLIGLQFVATWISVRSPRFKRLITGEPRLVVSRGQLLRGELRRARVTENEILAAIRNAGLESLEESTAVTLETDGSFSVIARTNEDTIKSIRTVRRARPSAE